MQAILQMEPLTTATYAFLVLFVICLVEFARDRYIKKRNGDRPIAARTITNLVLLSAAGGLVASHYFLLLYGKPWMEVLLFSLVGSLTIARGCYRPGDWRPRLMYINAGFLQAFTAFKLWLVIEPLPDASWPIKLLGSVGTWLNLLAAVLWSPLIVFTVLITVRNWREHRHARKAAATQQTNNTSRGGSPSATQAGSGSAQANPGPAQTGSGGSTP